MYILLYVRDEAVIFAYMNNAWGSTIAVSKLLDMLKTHVYVRHTELKFTTDYSKRRQIQYAAWKDRT